MNGSRRLVFLLLLALAAARPAAAQTPSAAVAAVDTAAFRQQIAEVLRQVSHTRGLEPVLPVEPWLQSRSDLAAYVRRQFEREDAARRLRSEGKALTRFGLLPPGYSLADSLLAIYDEQIGGVYDYHSDRLLLADWLEPELQTPVMAHELVHALQDQRYQIGIHLDSLTAAGDDDATEAFLALAEGDATAVMLEFTARSLGLTVGDLQGMAPLLPELLAQMSGQAPRLASAPRVVQQSLLFPYVQGTAFVIALRRTVPWAEFDRVYARPPTSSRDILHPDLYLAGDRDSARVEWSPDLARPCCPGRYENTLGEWGLRLILSRALPDSVATSAAEGWRADRYVLFGADSDRGMVFLATMWQDESKAVEFYRAASLVLLTGWPGAEIERTGLGERGDLALSLAPHESSWVERRGSTVLIALGDLPSSRDSALRSADEIWRAVRFTDGR
jgi:hypothetical protein